MKEDKKRYYIWGTGNIAERIDYLYKEQLDKLDIVGYIDNDLRKVGNNFKDKKIYSPDILLNDQESYIIIANTFEKEIKCQIDEKYPWAGDKIMDSLYLEKLSLISRYKNNTDMEIQNILNYLENHSLNIFNYSFVDKYASSDTNIEYDGNKGLYYVIHCGKKMYFSKSYKTFDEVRTYYQSICIEQDSESPHKYLNSTFNVNKDSVVIDAGVAEGNFALSIIESVKRIYLFEPDESWIEALNYTFEPFKDKVVFVNKSLSNFVDRKTTTIDTEVNEKVDFIKLDIEGEEYYALEGAKKTILSSKHMQCAVCTYHQEFAYEKIRAFLSEQQFQIETSNGYMWYPSEMYSARASVLRRGLIRAKK